MRYKPLFLLVGAVLLAGCASVTLPDGTPGWLRVQVAGWSLLPGGNSPQAVYRYQYNGQTVYYFQAPCCDQYNVAYSVQGQAICAPDGGLTGRGDGKCSDFKERASGGELVWQASSH